MAAIACGRLSQFALPHRMRPLHAQPEGFNLAYGVNPLTLDGWSSMPSDHAVMFFAIAFSLVAIDRVIGVLAILHAMLFVSLPRIFLGFHYPGDIVIGAILAAVMVFALFSLVSRQVTRWRIVALADSYPQIFYPVLFILTLEIATMFDAVRQLLGYAATLIRSWSSG